MLKHGAFLWLYFMWAPTVHILKHGTCGFVCKVVSFLFFVLNNCDALWSKGNVSWLRTVGTVEGFLCVKIEHL